MDNNLVFFFVIIIYFSVFYILSLLKHKKLKSTSLLLGIDILMILIFFLSILLFPTLNEGTDAAIYTYITISIGIGVKSYLLIKLK